MRADARGPGRRGTRRDPGDARSQFRAEPARQLVLVRDDDAVGRADRGRNRVPVERRDRPQIHDHRADAVLLRLLCRDERPLHHRAPRDDDHVGAGPADGRAAEGNREVRAGIRALVVRLAIQVLVLEEEHRIVAADRRAQQPRRVLGGRRVDDAQAGAVREDALAGLAVVQPAAAQVSADRHADDHRAREHVVGAVPQHRHFVAELHHRRPDVVEELDLDDRLEPARAHAARAADDGRLGERRVEDAIGSEGALQAQRRLEDAALARHFARLRLVRRVRDVFAEHDDVRVRRPSRPSASG